MVKCGTVRTPDSAPDSKDLYRDNCAYMDKLVGNANSMKSYLSNQFNAMSKSG